MSSNRLTRRTFLQVSTTAAGGILIGAPLAGCSDTGEAYEAAKFGFFLAIEPDGKIRFKAPTANIGQGVWTGQAMIVAEELDVTVDQIDIEHLPLILRRNEQGELRGVISQGAGGSHSTRVTFEPLADAAAEVRERLVRAAAKRWRVSHLQCRTENGAVHYVGRDDRFGYGELAAEAATIDLNNVEITRKDKSDYRVIGFDQPTYGLESIVTGKERYGIDFELSGMKYAVIERAPNFGARVQSYDDREALATPGVLSTVLIQGAEPSHYDGTILGDGVAVVADSFWAALTARRKLKIEWRDGPFIDETDETLGLQADSKISARSPLNLNIADMSEDEVRQGLERGITVRKYGDPEEAFHQADRTISRTYDLPFIAHATMEPQNCTASVYEGGCDLYAPTQSPGSASYAVANYLGISRENVNVHMLRSGGGFGRRLKIDYALEAVMVSKQVGVPVKVIWTREDDIRYDYYRSRARFEMNAAVNSDKQLTGWHVREASAPLETTLQRVAMGERWNNLDVSQYFIGNNFLAGEELVFENLPAHRSFIPNFQMDHFFMHSGAPRHAWRAPGVHSIEFANQSFLCEIAHELDEDPVEFLLRLIGAPSVFETEFSWVPAHDSGRLAKVLSLAAEKSEWGKKYAAPGYGQGAAVTFMWGTYAAQVVDVHINETGELSVLNVTCAMDCGFVVNPVGATKQAEGAVCDALSMALGQEINIRNGAPVQSNFHDYKMMRMAQSPRTIDVHFVQGDDSLVGMGEAAVPPLAPALCNAIFAATGKRIRKLPIGDQLQQ